MISFEWVKGRVVRLIQPPLSKSTSPSLAAQAALLQLVAEQVPRSPGFPAKSQGFVSESLVLDIRLEVTMTMISIRIMLMDPIRFGSPLLLKNELH